MNLRAHLRSNTVGYIALCVALSGSAYAAATIKSSDIVDDQVKSADVRDDSLKGGGLTGDDIKENTLGTVKNAVKVNKIAASRSAKPRKLLALDGNGRLAAGPSDMSVLEGTPCTREGKQGRLDTFHSPRTSPSVGSTSLADLTLNCLVRDNLEPDDTALEGDTVHPSWTNFAGTSIFPAGDVDNVQWVNRQDFMTGGWSQTVRLNVPSGADLLMDVFHEGARVADDVTCFVTGATEQEQYRAVVSGVDSEVGEYQLMFDMFSSPC